MRNDPKLNTEDTKKQVKKAANRVSGRRKNITAVLLLFSFVFMVAGASGKKGGNRAI